MKKDLITRSLLNLLWYSAVAISMYLLYSPSNTHPANQAGSSVQFVYQQF